MKRRQGEQAAAIWKEPVTQLQHQLKRYCLGLTGNSWDAEELVQETWTKAVQAGDADHANLQALLKRMAKNRWISHARKAKLERDYIEQAGKHAPSAHDADTLYIEQIFQAIFRHLTPMQRAVFLLKDVFGYSLQEIAQALRTTLGAVKSSLHRARQKLSDIQRSLEHDRPASEEEERALWALLATAYLDGDTAQIVRLALHNELEPAVTLAIARNVKQIQASSQRASGRSSQLSAA